VVGYHSFRRPCCILPPSSPWRWRKHCPLKRWYSTRSIYGITTETTTWLSSIIRKQNWNCISTCWNSQALCHFLQHMHIGWFLAMYLISKL